MTRIALVLFLCAAALPCAAQVPVPSEAKTTYEIDRDLLYRDGELTDYMKERCRLDVYHPINKKRAT